MSVNKQGLNWAGWARERRAVACFVPSSFFSLPLLWGSLDGAIARIPMNTLFVCFVCLYVCLLTTINNRELTEVSQITAVPESQSLEYLYNDPKRMVVFTPGFHGALRWVDLNFQSLNLVAS